MSTRERPVTTTSARSRVRRPGTAVVVAAALVAGVLLGGGPAGAAPDSASAAAQATRLAAQVAELQNRTEAATEQYDAVTADLAGVVTESIQAGARIDALSTEAADSQAAATNRVSALYMSGGDLSLYATVLDGTSPNDLLDRLTTVEDLVGQDRTQVIGLTQQVAAAAATQSRLAALAAHRITLEKQAQAARAVVVGLLARSQQALASANAEVVALVAQEQAATEAAAEAQARAALGADYTVTDLGHANPYAAAAIAAARTRIGDPYVWGATGPKSFDCSGLVQWAYAQAGLSLMRVAADQYRSGPVVPLDALAPGDLLFWATDPAVKATIHHVALYVGGGQMIEAPHTGAFVRLVPIRLGPQFAGAVRPGLGAPVAPTA